MNIKSITGKDFILLSLLIILFLLSRLINISSLPIFTDEAIYMRWAQIALGDSSWRFISLIDGKQPMLIWLTMPILKLTGMPLLSGRLVSVVAGMLGTIGAFFLGWELFKNKTIGYITALLYLVSPFFLWHDRIALYDSLLSGFYVWVLFLEVILVRRLRLDIALILGMVIGGAVLTKTSGFFAIYLLPFFILLLDFKKLKRELPKFIGLSVISVIIAYGMYGVLRLSPWFYIINQKNHEFIYSYSEILSDPFAYIIGNLRGLGGWWVAYTTIPFVILLIVALFWKDKKTIKERILFFLLFFLPFFALAVFGKVLYPRFILFMTLSLLPLYAYAIEKIWFSLKRSLLRIIFIIIIFIYPIYFDSQIIFNVINTPLPGSDRSQYLDDWPAGYGVIEVITYLNTEKENQPIYLATEGTFGLFPYAFELEYYDDSKVTVKGYWPLPTQQTLEDEARSKPIFLVLKESQKLPSGYDADLINQYRRGLGDTYLKFYRLK